MSDSFIVERASVCDFPELMKILALCFNSERPEYPDFDKMLPDLYSPSSEDMANSLIIRDGGKIVSHIALFPMQIMICSRPVEIGGLGGVCTLVEYRGKHLMQQILDHTQEIMLERDYPIGWLSGDRRRYSPWGYENSNIEYLFTLHARAPGCDKYDGKLPGSIVEGTVDELDWDELWRQARSETMLSACGEERLKRKYRRFRLKVYMVGGKDGAHLVVREENNNRDIYGYAGDPNTLGAILRSKLQSTWETARAFLPIYPDRYFNVFHDLMKWHEIQGAGSISIVNLAKTFEIFLPYFNEKVRNSGLKGKISLTMQGARKIPAQTVRLEADGKEFHIGKDITASRTSIIELNALQMSELIFGSFSPVWFTQLPTEAKWLTMLFPVPFSVSLLYHV